jgi:hypothetical protein
LRFAIRGVLWVAILTIVFLVVDCAAFAVQFALETRAFTRCDFPIAARESFVDFDPRKSRFKPRGFAASQLAATYALADALLLAPLAVVYATRARHRYRTESENKYSGNEKAQ